MRHRIAQPPVYQLHAPPLCATEATPHAPLKRAASRSPASPPRPNASRTHNRTPSIYAAISIIASQVGQLRQAIGEVRKHRGGPLFSQDTPWEPRIDNGYPNVLPPTMASEAWQLWYGDCTATNDCSVQLLLYANSTDGLVWHKPKLGIFDLASVRPDLAHIGTANNVLLRGGGIGISRDSLVPSAAHPYKAFGPACYDGGVGGCELKHGGGQLGSTVGTAELGSSPDGLHWSASGRVEWPPPQRFDCHNNVFWDSTIHRYIATTRIFMNETGRAIGIALSPNESFGFDSNTPPLLVAAGNRSHQLYSQITFPWCNIYLGIVMVYDAEDAAGRVHCRLAWSRRAHSATWEWVDAGGLTGADFIPAGEPGSFDSHICFAARPVPWGNVERLYYMGGNGPHSGHRNSSFGLAVLRADGYAALRGSGVAWTIPLLCTAPQLTVTVDFEPGGGSLVVRVVHTKSPENMRYTSGRSSRVSDNVTNQLLRFEGGEQVKAQVGDGELQGLVGDWITLELQLERALLYTLGFV